MSGVVVLPRSAPCRACAALVLIGLSAALAGCTAGRAPPPVVEVVAPSPSAEPSPAASPPPPPEPAAVVVVPEPSAPLVPASPAARAPGPVAGTDPAPHLEGTWLAVRARDLGLDPAAAALRDQSMAGQPPTGAWWDEALARESWALWRGLCAECHGGKRSLAKVLKFPAPSADWADEDALYFTRLRSPRAMYTTVLEGRRATRPGERDMPAWRRALTHEQAWALVYYVRSASKGRDLR